jgi:hypothetical protein
MNTILASAIQRIRDIVRAIVNGSEVNIQSDLFYNSYLEVKSYYLYRFGKAPSVLFINNIDPGKALEYLLTNAAGKVIQVHQSNFYNWEQQRQEFTLSIVELEGKILIELGRDFAELAYDVLDHDRAEQIMQALVDFPKEKEEGQHQIHIINSNNYGLDLKPLNIQPCELDLNLYYNDDFIEVDAKIQERLLKEQDKGIVLLHGLPGTGKTTYLRYLIGKVRKKVLFLSPSVAGNLMNPDFMDLLIEHPNSILVIEDAENIILDRTYQSNHSVSNLLNLSDGLLSDCLNVQIICTFNSALHLVDPALLRKGRLIAQYEFGKLSVAKAQQLAGKLNIETTIDAPVSLAELLNPASTNYEPKKTQVMGFRRVLATN